MRAYESALYSSLHHIQQGGEHPDDEVEHIWSMFKSAIREASQSLPVLPNKQPVEWMMEELLNLSHKKRDAWMSLQNKDPKSDDPTLQQEYKRLCKLTKIAAEKARNAWWSERAAEAKKRVWFAEQLGQGGSLVKELRLLCRQVSKLVVTPLLAKDSSPITSDDGKLRRWAEHFKEVVNCDSVVSETVLDILPVVACKERPENVSDSDLCAPFSEEEVSTAISQMKSGKTPGIDNISAELLKIGGGGNCTVVDIFVFLHLDPWYHTW